MSAKHPRSIRRRVLRAIVLASAALGIVFCATLLYVLSGMGGNAQFPADCGIVFGAAVRPVRGSGGTITTSAGPGILRRVETAVALYRAGDIHRLFLTGGKGDGEQKSEAQVMRDVAMQEGIPASAIVVEERSRSTQENLLFTRPLTSGCTSIVAISDGYHLTRIGLLASFIGWKLQTYPAQKQAPDLFIVQSLLREALGVDYLVVLHLLT